MFLTPRLRPILLICFIAIFILSATMLLLDYAQETKEENALKNLAGMVNATSESAPQESGILAQYRALHGQNPDMAGWIRLDGTPIDYPVMYTPKDGNFYLNHGFDRENSKSGVPFIDERCAANPLGVITIIYGHHMKNGAMFAALENYRDQDYCRAHPTIRFDTLYAQQEYEIIAAFETQIYQKNDTAFKYYSFANIDSAEAFNEYTANIKALSLYDTGVTVSYGDTLLMLVTCDYHTENGRFVVVARKE